MPIPGLASIGSLFGSTGGGEKSTTTAMPATSGISGATSFSTGGLTVNKADNTMLIVVAAVAGLILLAVMRK